jgi:hypothetical protein
LHFPVPVTQFMPPPGAHDPIRWLSNQTLALTSFLTYGDYKP